MLCRLNLSDGVLGEFFLVMLNLRPKNFLEFFHVQSAFLSEFFSGDVWVPNCFGHSKFELKIFLECFSLPSALD